MARRLGLLWLAVPALAGVALVIAYVPPKGAARRGNAFYWASRGAQTPEQARLSRITEQWQMADVTIRLARARQQLAPELQRRRAADSATLAVVFQGAFSDSAEQWLRGALYEAWRALGLGTTKIGVGVVISLEDMQPATAQRPRPTVPYSAWYLLPDSTDRHTCVAIAAPGRQSGLAQRPGGDQRQTLFWLRRVLGPCAFYASFGKPSPVIARWLSARRYDLAADALWDGTQHRGPERWWIAEMGSTNRRWMWQWLYALPPTIAGCAGGRVASCRAYALAGAESERAPRTVITSIFEWRAPPLPGATELLSDAVREFGRARFARFWTTDLPVDSAFHVAMDTTLGDWVWSRQRAHGTTLEVGPAAPLGASVISLGIAAVGLVLAVAAATRRQIS